MCADLGRCSMSFEIPENRCNGVGSGGLPCRQQFPPPGVHAVHVLEPDQSDVVGEGAPGIMYRWMCIYVSPGLMGKVCIVSGGLLVDNA